MFPKIFATLILIFAPLIAVAEAAREEALKPFVRLDAARNQDKGSGVGLGLAITHDIARRHGGSLRLSDGQILGGLRCEIILPR